MKEFRIKSSLSDVELRLFNIHGDYFTIEIVSSNIKAAREVWAYTDSYTFADFLEALASQDSPWEGSEAWESIEGEFKFWATCSKLRQITFEIELNQSNITEAWLMNTKIRSDFGSLPILAKTARKFFGNSPY